MPVPPNVAPFLQNPGMTDQLQGLLQKWQSANPQGYQHLFDQASQAWNSYGPSLMSEWQNWPNIASFDTAAGAPGNIPQDLYSQSPNTARFIGDLLQHPNQTTKNVPQVGQGNFSQAPGLTGAAAGLDRNKQPPKPVVQPGQGNEPLAGIGRR